MAKIYRRTTLISGIKKQKDEKKRKRSIIMNFRVSPEEKQMIEERVKLSGMAKGYCRNPLIIPWEYLTFHLPFPFGVCKRRKNTYLSTPPPMLLNVVER